MRVTERKQVREVNQSHASASSSSCTSSLQPGLRPCSREAPAPPLCSQASDPAAGRRHRHLLSAAGPQTLQPGGATGTSSLQPGLRPCSREAPAPPLCSREAPAPPLCSRASDPAAGRRRHLLSAAGRRRHLLSAAGPQTLQPGGAGTCRQIFRATNLYSPTVFLKIV